MTTRCHCLVCDEFWEAKFQSEAEVCPNWRCRAEGDLIVELEFRDLEEYHALLEERNRYLEKVWTSNRLPCRR